MNTVVASARASASTEGIPELPALGVSRSMQTKSAMSAAFLAASSSGSVAIVSVKQASVGSWSGGPSMCCENGSNRHMSASRGRKVHSRGGIDFRNVLYNAARIPLWCDCLSFKSWASRSSCLAWTSGSKIGRMRAQTFCFIYIWGSRLINVLTAIG